MRESIFTQEEIEIGIASLGKRGGEVEFLREKLLSVVFSSSGIEINGCALSFREGRRTMAADLLNMLDLPLSDDRLNIAAGGGQLDRIPRGTARRVPIEPPGGYGRGPRPARGRKPAGNPSDMDS